MTKTRQGLLNREMVVRKAPAPARWAFRWRDGVPPRYQVSPETQQAILQSIEGVNAHWPLFERDRCYRWTRPEPAVPIKRLLVAHCEATKGECVPPVRTACSCGLCVNPLHCLSSDRRHGKHEAPPGSGSSPTARGGLWKRVFGTAQVSAMPSCSNGLRCFDACFGR